MSTTSQTDGPTSTVNAPKAAAHLLLSAGLSCVAFLIFLAVLDGVRDNARPVTAFDHDILTYCHAHQEPFFTAAARVLAAMGEPTTIVGIAIVGTVLGFFVRKVRGAAWTLPIAVIGAGVLIQSVKMVMKRQRPDLFVPLLHETGYSFPSGHSLIAMVVYGLLGYFAMHLFAHRAARFAVGVVTVALVFSIGLSRVYVGVHYPSDVLAGWSLGLPWLCGCLALHERLARKYGGKVGEPVFPAKDSPNPPAPSPRRRGEGESGVA